MGTLLAFSSGDSVPAPRVNMRKIKHLLRLKLDAGLSHEQIASAPGISKGVVTKYVGLASPAAFLSCLWLLALSAMEIRAHVIPDVVTLPLRATGVVINLTPADFSGLAESVIGATGTYLLLAIAN
jgi:prepilin signal peptidase PulO-like enzyme (type II secretory pathway)